MTTINKNTTELAIGDVVVYGNAKFKLTERKDYGDCLQFKTECVHFTPDGPIPKHWTDDWLIQGNKLALWAVEA